MIAKIEKNRLITLLREAGEVFRFCAKKTKILATISWGPDAVIEFFKKKESQIPKPVYSVDQVSLTQALQALLQLAPKLKGDHPVMQWLSSTQESMLYGVRLLLELENDNFYEFSSRLYGNSRTKPFEGNVTNLELASALTGRINVCNFNEITESVVLKSSEEFVAALERRLKERKPVLPVKIELSNEIAAKAVAGMNRIRIRKDARFSELEVDALFDHEIESHCLTAHNGGLQENCEFLSSGGPRTTMTQEGLAVFFEMYGHTMSQRRFLALCDRIHAVKKVEEGADFMELYRWYKDRTDSDMDAFYSAQRIFRGANLKGGAPFTKDVVYLAGLLEIYNFLRLAVKNQNRLLVESLVCGRIALEDVGIIAWLRTHGILSPPRYIPQWLENWEALVSYFSFSAFLNSVDLNNFQSYFDEHTLRTWDLGL